LAYFVQNFLSGRDNGLRLTTTAFLLGNTVDTFDTNRHTSLSIKNLFQTQSTLFDSTRKESRSVFYRRAHRFLYILTESEHVLEQYLLMFIKKLIV